MVRYREQMLMPARLRSALTPNAAHRKIPPVSAPSRLLLTFLALFAVAGAQVYGLQRGYLCLCSGGAVETQHSHCDEEPHDCGGEHPHEPLTVKHEAPTQPGPSAANHLHGFFAITPQPDLARAWAGDSAARSVLLQPPRMMAAGPPASLMVAECIVLLV